MNKFISYLNKSNIFNRTSSVDKAVAKPEKKLKVYATKLLNNINGGYPLKRNQKIKLVASSEHLPLVKQLMETAYKKFKSGRIIVDIKEPELEALKKNRQLLELDYKKRLNQEFKTSGAANINLYENVGDKTLDPYIQAGLEQGEIKALQKTIKPQLSQEVKNKLEIDPKEILDTCLGMRPGQPLLIRANREHMPHIVKLVEEAYNRGTKLVDVEITENSKYDLDKPMIRYASNTVLQEQPSEWVSQLEEYKEKGFLRLTLDGDDPNQKADLKKAEKIKNSARQDWYDKLTKELRSKLFKLPWCRYYMPTVASAKVAGYGDNYLLAFEDMKRINRVGSLDAHLENLIKRTKIMNKLVKEGYRKLKFTSVDPNTGKPDNSTDLTVVLTPKSKFISGGLTTKDGQRYLPNVPTEEMFSAVDWKLTTGHVSITRPVKINDVIVKDIKFYYKGGEVYKATASENEDVLLDWLKDKSACRIGEIALVAGSPIFDTGKIFQLILLDENATSHLAGGDSYPICIEGGYNKDGSINKALLKELNVNESSKHIDFMIGNKHVITTVENTLNSDLPTRTLIEDNKFNEDIFGKAA